MCRPSHARLCSMAQPADACPTRSNLSASMDGQRLFVRLFSAVRKDHVIGEVVRSPIPGLGTILDDLCDDASAGAVIEGSARRRPNRTLPDADDNLAMCRLGDDADLGQSLRVTGPSAVSGDAFVISHLAPAPRSDDLTVTIGRLRPRRAGADASREGEGRDADRDTAAKWRGRNHFQRLPLW